MTTKRMFLLLVISFEDHFRFLILLISKYLHINKIKIFDLNTVKKEKAVRSQSKVSKRDSAPLGLVIVSWLLLQSFDTFFLIFHYKFY